MVRILANVTSWKQLEIALQKARDKALKAAGEKTVDVVKQEIQKEVYDIPEGTYERTYALKDSLTDGELEIKGNTAQVEISHDWFNMPYNVEKFQHASPYWSPWKYTRYVAETVHEGASGNLFGTEGHWHERKPYMDNAKDRMSKGEYKKFMIDQLKKDGFKVE